MYKKILVPLDGSARAEKILPHVEELAYRYNAKVAFVQVVELTTMVIADYESSGGYMLEWAEQAKEEAEGYLSSWRGKFIEKGIEASVSVEPGHVVETIIKVAEQEDVDLIAMASHGRTGLSHVFYGSVAIGVLHRVDRPMLLIRSQDNA